MPIRADCRKFYGREWRAKWRPYLIERSGDRCESCGAPNGATVLTLPNGLWLDPGTQQWCAPSGVLPFDLFSRLESRRSARTLRWKRVKCGGAHLDHDPSHNDPDNLRWWCDACHLRHDQSHHAANARLTRQVHKDEDRPLFTLLQGSS